MRVGDKYVVPTVDDVGASVLLQLLDVERSHLVDGSSQLSVISLDDLKPLGNSGSREGVGTSGESNTGGDGEGDHEGVVRDDVATIGRESLGKDTADKVAGTDHVKVLLNTVSSLAEGTEGVGLVHDQEGVEVVTASAGLGQVGDGTISRVDGVEDEEGASRVLVAVLLHQLAEGFVVLVRELDELGAGQFGSVSQADVALLVHEDDTTLRAQVGNQVHAGQKPGGSEGAVFAVEELLHVLIGLVNDGVLPQQQVGSVVTGSGLTHLLEGVFSHFFVHVESPVGQGGHQGTGVVITLDLDGDTVIVLLEGQPGGEGPVLVDVVNVMVAQHFTSNVNVGGGHGLVGDNRFLGLDGVLNQAPGHIEVGQVAVVLAVREELLGHLVLLDLLGDELGGVGDNQSGGGGKEQEQNEQNEVGEHQSSSNRSSPSCGGDINQTNHLFASI
mmetsp:Transcript_22643/g.35218  ORF Transcript_22643/g.35218 Transcript_22643/m.35218 type:complete len:443 (-) Transcript_22643:86-1414(-)